MPESHFSSTTMPAFKQVDVFATKKFRGNPVAVFFDAGSIPTEEKAIMSAWTNLSEATFVEKPTHPDADYKVRIFAHEAELPFAGHPTIGTCYALLEEGLIKPKNGRIIQECGAGLVQLTVSDTVPVQISFELPYVRRTDVPLQHLPAIASALGVPKILGLAIYEVGPVWGVMELTSAEEVLALEPDYTAVAAISKLLKLSGLQVFGPHPEKDTYETRTFVSESVGVNEDPVCGSGSGATGAYLRDAHGFTGSAYLRQGTVLNREGRVRVECGQTMSVLGSAVTIIRGEY